MERKRRYFREKITTITRDDEGKPNQAVTVAQELVANNVAAVIGHFNSGCTIPASEIYKQNNILQITPGSTNPDVTERGYKTLFASAAATINKAKPQAIFQSTNSKLKKLGYPSR
ncbi:MAG: ABC transporter substrate-binding protein [Verrucomicrobiia bacterium]